MSGGSKTTIKQWGKLKHPFLENIPTYTDTKYHPLKHHSHNLNKLWEKQ